MPDGSIGTLTVGGYNAQTNGATLNSTLARPRPIQVR